MSVQQIIVNFFLMLGGLTVFMVGMKMMSDNLERAAGGNMRSMLRKISDNRLVGVGVGAATTAIIQSSAATTVMLVGFVNVGLMTLYQAVPVIMGANIGTTVTAQIFSLQGGSGGMVTAIAALIAAVCLFAGMTVKNDRVRRICDIFVGLGLIFVGLEFMQNAMSAFKSEAWFQNMFKGGNFFLLILVGIAATAVVQSSSAITGILVSLAAAGFLGFNDALFVILGSNIGTCVTTLLSSVGASTNAKRTAVLHLLFNVLGCLIVVVPLAVWTDEVAWFFRKISGARVERQIANFHTVFNVLVTVILLPFSKYLVSLATLLVPDKKGKKKAEGLVFLDPRILETPVIAVEQAKKEIAAMAELSFGNVVRSLGILLEGKFEQVPAARETEKRINYLNHEITAFLVQISACDLSERDEKKIGSYYHVVSDVERIGDYAENFVNYAERMQREGIEFSDNAKEEVSQVLEKLRALYELTMRAFELHDRSVLPEIDAIENQVDDAKRKMSDAHVERMTCGACTPAAGAVYLQIAGNLERIADHMTNVSEAIYAVDYKRTLPDGARTHISE